ncbi:trp operon leader peptide [Streptomyces sp. NBC_00028]|uniref:trp operon leader peptide n=1 Tax=Streptomyces sp. NBC_00028 TaxID=2975624 RepID=UPI00386B07FC
MSPPPPVRPQASRRGMSTSMHKLRHSCEGTVVCGASCRVPGMFAHSTQNWWWTAHPAAH